MTFDEPDHRRGPSGIPRERADPRRAAREQDSRGRPRATVRLQGRPRARRHHVRVDDPPGGRGARRGVAGARSVRDPLRQAHLLRGAGHHSRPGQRAHRGGRHHRGGRAQLRGRSVRHRDHVARPLGPALAARGRGLRGGPAARGASARHPSAARRPARARHARARPRRRGSRRIRHAIRRDPGSLRGDESPGPSRVCTSTWPIAPSTATCA